MAVGPQAPRLPLRLYQLATIAYRLPDGRLATVVGHWDGTTDHWGRLRIEGEAGEVVYLYPREVERVKEVG